MNKGIANHERLTGLGSKEYIPSFAAVSNNTADHERISVEINEADSIAQELFQVFENIPTPEERLFLAAKTWWELHRPPGWTEKQHLEHPIVNTSGAGIDLARCVAHIVWERSKNG